MIGAKAPRLKGIELQAFRPPGGTSKNSIVHRRDGPEFAQGTRKDKLDRSCSGVIRRLGRNVSKRWRDWRRPGIFFATLLAPALSAFGLEAQESPKAAPTRDLHAEARPAFPYQTFAVHIFRKPRQSWPGFGIYLGDGLILTAAHVVGHPTQGDPSVEIAGLTLEARVVKEGEFETVDLTLLRVDPRQLPPSLGLRLMPLCKEAPRVGQPVVVATPEALSASHILSPKALPRDLRADRFDTLIADVATTGNSGSGVFDPANQCLMGIMSRKIQVPIGDRQNPGAKPKMVDVAKYFVPAREIGPFIGPR